jgi:hypothetical protein
MYGQGCDLAREEDPATIEGQLEFVGYELCNSYEGIGRARKQRERWKKRGRQSNHT